MDDKKLENKIEDEQLKRFPAAEEEPEPLARRTLY